MSNHFKLQCSCILIIIIILFITCTYERHSVFWAVIEDRPELNLNLDDDLSIIGMTDDGTDYYVATAGSLWKRPISGNDSAETDQWISFSRPEDAVNCLAFTGHDSGIYASFMLSDNTFGLYRGEMAEDPAWTAVTDTDVQGAGIQVTNLFSVNNTLFASIMINSTSHSLFYLDGTDFIATGIQGAGKPVTSVTWDNTYFWAVAGDQVYRDPAPDNFQAFSNLPETEENEYFYALYFSANNNTYYLSLNNGLVYASTDPDTDWPENSGEQIINEVNINFTVIAEIDSNILVGTTRKGFYQTKDGDITILERHEDELISDINQSSILNFYIDESENTVFFLTIGYGLYRNTYTEADGWENLIHE